MEITQVIRRRRATAPPSLRAQIVLVLSAFLSGTALAGLLFVGIWRHTAADGERAKAQQAVAHRDVVAAEHRLADVTALVQREHAASLAAQRRARTAEREAATLTATNKSLTPKLAAAEAAAHALVTKLSTLQSELSALQSYVRQPGAAGLDPGYLASQLRYLSASVDAAASAASAAANGR